MSVHRLYIPLWSVALYVCCCTSGIYLVHAHTMAMHWPAIVAPQLGKLKRRKQQDIDGCMREADDDAEREQRLMTL